MLRKNAPLALKILILAICALAILQFTRESGYEPYLDHAYAQAGGSSSSCSDACCGCDEGSSCVNGACQEDPPCGGGCESKGGGCVPCCEDSCNQDCDEDENPFLDEGERISCKLQESIDRSACIFSECCPFPCNRT